MYAGITALYVILIDKTLKNITVESQVSGRKVSHAYLARTSVQTGKYCLVFKQPVLHFSAHLSLLGCSNPSRNADNKQVMLMYFLKNPNQNQKQELLAAGRMGGKKENHS